MANQSKRVAHPLWCLRLLKSSALGARYAAGRLRVERSMRIGWMCVAALVAAGGASAQVADFKIEGDGIPKSLTGKPGVAMRGKALLAKREAANCLECHSIKDRELGAGGTKGPALDGIGAVLTPAQLRMSIVDISMVLPKTAMPSFHKEEGAATKQQGKPRLSAQDVEDVVAYLSSLRR
jgi:sulfur-oxidizing protein SoxX